MHATVPKLKIRQFQTKLSRRSTSHSFALSVHLILWRCLARACYPKMYPVKTMVATSSTALLTAIMTSLQTIKLTISIRCSLNSARDKFHVTSSLIKQLYHHLTVSCQPAQVRKTLFISYKLLAKQTKLTSSSTIRSTWTNRELPWLLSLQTSQSVSSYTLVFSISEPCSSSPIQRSMSQLLWPRISRSQSGTFLHTQACASWRRKCGAGWRGSTRGREASWATRSRI